MPTASVVLRHIVSILAGLILAASPALAQTPLAGPNINMVSGTTWPGGDPFLTKQNEVSIAVSSLNPQHLLAGANDYRLTDPRTAIFDIEGEADAWLTVYKSTDGGLTWRTALIQGCPLNIPECSSDPQFAPIRSLAAVGRYAADPTVRAGPYGTFFYSFIAGNRISSAGGVTAIQRFFDNNNNIRIDGSQADPFVADGLNIIDVGTVGQFKDKPWNGADVPGRPWNNGTCIIPGYNNGQPVPAFNAYISYANFVGQATGNPHPQVLVARSTDCGKTFGKPVKLSNSIQTNQGSNLAIDPQTGTVYVFWRVIGDPQVADFDAIYMSKSSDGGATWSNQAIPVAEPIIPYDQEDSGASFRTLTFASAAVSVDATTGQSRVHVIWAQRKAALDASGNCTVAAPLNCDARIRMATSGDGGATWTQSWVDNWAVDNSVTLLNQQTGTTSPLNHGRGHQFMPALSFAGGKLMAIWYDQRLDQTVGRMVCTAVAPATCTSMLDFDEVRVLAGNLAATPPSPQFVFTPFLVDGPIVLGPTDPSTGLLAPDPAQGLVRRHTIDVYAAMADPANTPAFTSNRVSQYLFGSLKSLPSNDPLRLQQCPPRGICVEQQQQNPPNLPIAVGGTVPFIGDYLDVAAQNIVPTAPATPNGPAVYKFNCGRNAGSCADIKTTPVFHPAWTDNRDVVRPFDGNWQHHTPVFALNASGTGVVLNNSANFGTNFCAPGQDGTRNSNVYTAVVADRSLGLANANSKLLDPSKPRGFVVGVQNLSDVDQSYVFSILPNPLPAGTQASFNQNLSFAPSVNVTVPPRSSTFRTVWVISSSSSASLTVGITYPNGTPVSQVALNPDPLATLNLNTDGTTTDLSFNTLTNATLTNATLTNNTLSNNSLTNVTLSNVTLSNATLSNNTLSNIDPTTVTLSNATLTNNTLSNATLTNATLTNATLSNATLSNVTLSNVDLSSANLTNAALTNITLSNNSLTNTELSDASLTENDLTSASLTNSFPADTTYAVTNSGNTDTTIDVKTLLRGQTVPAGYTLQLVLRKVLLTPTAVGRCSIGLLQQSAQVANMSTPTAATDDSFLGQFAVNDPNAATLPLTKDEKAQLTLRVVKNTNCTTPTTCDAGDPGGTQALNFGQTGERFVAIGGEGTTTSIPLVIKTLSLPPVIVHKLITLPSVLKSIGGCRSGTCVNNNSNVTWKLINPPAWVTLSPANGVVSNSDPTTGTAISLVINKPPDIGTFILQIQVTDSSNPLQVDTNQLQLVVTANNP